MSEENVEVIRQAARAFMSGDWEEFGRLLTDDACLWALEGWPERGPFQGRRAFVDQFRRLNESWGTNKVIVEDHIEGGDWVVTRQRWIVEGAGSGVPADMTMFGAYRFEGGLIAECHNYWNRSEALEAAGLKE